MRAQEDTLTKRSGPKGYDWRPGFLGALAVTGTVSEACRAAGVSRTTAYAARAAGPAFAEAWEETQERVTDELEQEAIIRALHGREEVVGVARDGTPIVTVRRSDRLLEFLLRGRRRAVYNDRRALAVGVAVSQERLREMTDAELDALIARLGA